MSRVYAEVGGIGHKVSACVGGIDVVFMQEGGFRVELWKVMQ